MNAAPPCPHSCPTGLPQLRWLPDETLFSLCSRMHQLTGLPSSEVTSQLLFGHRRAAVHDLPGHLGAWRGRVREELAPGSLCELVLSRTLLGFYRPFLSPAQVAVAISGLGAGSMGALNFRLGLLNRLGCVHHPLKLCPACLEVDRARHHVAYWHQAHQWPGVWICANHGAMLRIDTQRAAAGMRFDWCLPRLNSSLDPRKPHRSPSRFAPPLEALAHLSHVALGLVDLPNTVHFDPEQLQATYLAALHRHGLLRRGGQLHHPAISDWLAPRFAALRAAPDLSKLPASPGGILNMAIPMLQRPDRRAHPLRHVALIACLFSSWEEFWASYAACRHAEKAQIASGAAASRTPPALAHPQRPRFLELMAQGRSASSAARTVGVDVATGRAWAAQAGLATPSRPKQLRGPAREGLVKDLAAGADKALVAQRWGVSIATVTRVLRTEVGLHTQWKAARHARAGHEARSAWQQAMAAQRTGGHKAARQRAPAAYAWLYRHDREWLLQSHPPPADRSRSARTRVDWPRRDQGLATQVLALKRHAATKPTHLWQLCLLAPELRAKLRVMHKLPRTRAAVDTLLARTGRPSHPGA
jgi:transposase